MSDYFKTYWFACLPLIRICLTGILNAGSYWEWAYSPCLKVRVFLEIYDIVYIVSMYLYSNVYISWNRCIDFYNLFALLIYYGLLHLCFFCKSNLLGHGKKGLVLTLEIKYVIFDICQQSQRKCEISMLLQKTMHNALHC